MAKNQTPKQKALTNNSPIYFTGKPCKYGHIAPRSTSRSQCTQCGKHWGYVNIDNRKKDIVQRVKAQAKLKNIPFSISVSDVEWNKICPILGIELEYFATGGRKQHSVSLDRINPDKGYIPGNVSTISVRANSIKSDMKVEQIKSLLKYVEDHLNG